MSIVPADFIGNQPLQPVPARRAPRTEGFGRYSLVVVVDDEPGIGTHQLTQTLEEQGLIVIRENTPEALSNFCQEKQTVVLAVPWNWPTCFTASKDDPTPGQDSSLLKIVRAHCQELVILIYADTSRWPVGRYCQLLAAGARLVVNQGSPTFVEDLRHTMLRFLRAQQSKAEEREHLSRLFGSHGLIGQSAALIAVFRRALKASHFSDLPVLIQGETGTGKQKLAEAIHALDTKRSVRPFVAINCSAVNKSLAESELFGHAKGAFSGADHARLGYFRSAEGGTLLLDEVGDLDAELQPKLLRVLQENRLLPVGEDEERPVDCRIIAATNRPLQDLVEVGQFRADLFQRLNVFQIHIPPLRERPDDIAVQARHFLSACQRDGQRVTGISPRVLEVLQLYPWEGNTRQLEHFMWETLAHKEGNGASLDMEDLPQWILEAAARVSGCVSRKEGKDFAPCAVGQQQSLVAAVEEFERTLLQRALAQNSGNRTRTAATLGLTPRSIFNKIKKYHLA